MADQIPNALQAEQRRRMVDGQLRTSDVTDLAVLAAFLDVPRERFVSANHLGLAYLDHDQLAAGASTRRLLAPRTLARLLQAAAIQPGERVLDVGAGSGYSSALIEALGASVVMLESDAGALEAARAALAGREKIEIVSGDVSQGVAAKAPFDAIVVNGAFAIAPESLLAQLAPGGRLVGIDAREPGRRAVLLERSAGGYSERALFDANGDVIEGLQRQAAFAL